MTRPPDHPHRGTAGDDRPGDVFHPAESDQARLLDAALDDLHRSAGVSGSAAADAGLDPALAETARQVHATVNAAQPRLRPMDKHHIWEDLMRSHASLGAGTPRPAATTTLSPPSMTATRPPSAAARALGAGSAGSAGSAPTGLGSSRPVVPHRTTPASRWLRRGWPAIELLGAAALIIGIVAVIIGATGGNRPAPTQFAGVGVGTAEATPAAETTTVATLPDPGNTGVMPGPGPVGQPELIWRVPIAQGGPVLAVGEDMVIHSLFPEEPLAEDRGPWTIEARTARAGTVAWDVELTADTIAITGIWEETVLVSTSTALEPLRFGSETIGEAGEAHVLGLDAANGDLRWSVALADASILGTWINGPVVTAAGTGYATTSRGSIVALDLHSGSIQWSADVRTDGAVTSSDQQIGIPAVADGIVTTFSLTTGHLYALDAGSGDRLWDRQVIDFIDPPEGLPADIQPAPAATLGGPAMVADRLYYTTSAYGDPDGEGEQSLVALDATTGEPTWEIELDPIDLTNWERPYGVSQPYVSGNVVAVMTGSQGTVTGYSALDGALLWEAPLDGVFGAQISIVGETMYLARSDGHLTAIVSTDGTELWSVGLGGSLGGAPFVVNEVIYQVGGTGLLFAIGGDGTTSAVNATLSAGTNISGQATCDVEPRPAPSVPGVGSESSISSIDEVGTPGATLAESDLLGPNEPLNLMQPTLAWPEIPVGTPADAETIAAIEQTVDGMTVCGRSGDLNLVAAHFTDDYFRRPFVVRTTTFGNALPSSEIPVMSGDVRMLDDGRAAMVVTEGLIQREIGQNEARLWVFAEQPDGQWLVDEVIILNDSGEAPQG
ncbi:MAG TPA: PQQ-binding-like beta-propeller repeat protein [Thermomicrobiales bacterium]|jgi:outer membrane protein assembly factor BamB|nr:PQQ-binding-like beta-propeller repeat protein [Thermomicrobiales bacterium]